MIEFAKISAIVDKIATEYKPEKIILFGSYSMGNPNDNSDLDLLIIKDTDLSRPERSHQVRKILFGALLPIDLIVYTPNEIDEAKDDKFSFVFEVLKTGKTLYERIN